jgi:hypothetical protein
VVATGTVYRINKPANSTPGAPAACGTTRKVPDVEFSWTDANGAYHTTLQGLDADDHPQYLLANGVRSAVDGFTVTGTFGAGTPLAVSGTGTRLLWYPRKAAFRAGRVTLGSMWDDANIGETSIALGEDTQANGPNAIAMGARSVASGSNALALGSNVSASALLSTAIGFDSRATGDLSIAMGTRASTNGQNGAFAIGDGSTTVPSFSDVYYVRPTAPNQFVARFANGYVLYTNSTHDAGVTLAPRRRGVAERLGRAPEDGVPRRRRRGRAGAARGHAGADVAVPGAGRRHPPHGPDGAGLPCGLRAGGERHDHHHGRRRWRGARRRAGARGAHARPAGRERRPARRARGAAPERARARWRTPAAGAKPRGVPARA